MSKMKAQNCPFCGKESSWSEGKQTAWCMDSDCHFGDFSYPIDLKNWNRIRIAPDGENVVKFSLMTDHRDGGQEIGSYISDAYILPSDDGDLAEYKDWMNPRYPDDE